MKWLALITTYTLIILAELGDKTQIATLILASNNPSKRWVVFGAGALALTTCVLIEVTIGTTIARLVSQEIINRVTGYVFVVVGLITLFREYAKSRKWRLRYGLIPEFTNKGSESV
ncbi:MAG: TMEM165/GDT1 family protein [Eubacteriales bacterium]